MNRTLIKDIQFEKQLKIAGFVDTYRNKGKMAFIIVRDISGKLQVTVEKARHPELIEQLDKITPESVISVTGKVIKSEFVKLNNMEMIPDEIELLSSAQTPPIDNESFLDLRMDYRWLDLRSERNTLIFQAQTLFVKAIRDFVSQHGFVEMHSPKIIGSASESGADVFALDYFGQKAFLAQSPQFYKQMAMASGFEKVFEIGPVFRAEKSNTSKHATEFTGFDVEMSYINSFHDVMQFEAEMLVYALEQIKQQYGDKIKEIFNLEVIVPTLPFPTIKLQDLYKELEQRYSFTVHPSESGDLTSEAEKMAYQLARDKYNHEFLFVTDYQANKRAFYHMRDGELALGYDLIWRGVEITTGAQREHRYEVICKQAAEKGLGDDVKFYLEFFKYGCPPHGGFGLGIDRMTMLLLGIGIKEAMYLFRGPSRLNP